MALCLFEFIYEQSKFSWPGTSFGMCPELDGGQSLSGERIFIPITWTPLEEGRVRELVTFVINGIVKHQAVLLGVVEQTVKKKKSLWDNIKKKNASETAVSTRVKRRSSKVKNTNKTFQVSQRLNTLRSPLQSCENQNTKQSSISSTNDSFAGLENKLPISPITPMLEEDHNAAGTPISMRRSTTFSDIAVAVKEDLLPQIDRGNIKKYVDRHNELKSEISYSSSNGLVQPTVSSNEVIPNCMLSPVRTPEHSVSVPILGTRRILSPDSFIKDGYEVDEDISMEKPVPILSPDQFVKDTLSDLQPKTPKLEAASVSSATETYAIKKWGKNRHVQSKVCVCTAHKLNDPSKACTVESQVIHYDKPKQNHLSFPSTEELQTHSYFQRDQPKKRPILSATVIKNKPDVVERKRTENIQPKSRKCLNSAVMECVDVLPVQTKAETASRLPVIGPISVENKCHDSKANSCTGSTSLSRKRKSEVHLESTSAAVLVHVEEVETKRTLMSSAVDKAHTALRPGAVKHMGQEKAAQRKKAGSSIQKASKTAKRISKPIAGLAQSHLTFVKPLKTAIPRHPMPFAAKNMFYDERWKEKQQRGFTWWLNFILTPDDFTVKANTPEVNAAALILGVENHHKTSVPKAPTKDEVSLKAYTAQRRLNKLRRAACRLFTSEKMVKAIKKLEFEVESRRLLVRKDRHLWKDVGERQKVLNWLLSYNPLWLRIGLETVYGELISLESNSDVMGLAIFILNRLLWNPDIAAEYRHPTVPHLYREGHEEALSKFTLKKMLLLICFLDCAKKSRIIDHDPCLFCKDAEFKSSKDVLLAFSRDFLSGEGDLSRHLSFLGLPVSHVQTPLDEFDFAVTNLAVDLQCGIRLVRTMELLTKNWNLSKQLRVPAISRLQKMHNVDIVLNVLKERGIQLKDESGASVDSRDIVDRHRERTLALLWKIVFAFQVDVCLNAEQLREEIEFLKNAHKVKRKLDGLKPVSNHSKKQDDNNSNASFHSYSGNVELLMAWVNAVCGFYNIKVENFTVCFSDGRVLCHLIHYYHPCYVPLESVCQRTTQTVECSRTHVVGLNSSSSSSESDTSLNVMEGMFDQTVTTSVLYKELLENEKKNFQLINAAVSDLGGIPAMIHHSDMSNTIPDEKVVITYLSFLCSRLLDLREETRAARLIQSAWRKYRLKKELKLSQERDKAARILQKYAIKFLSYRRILRKGNAAVIIQKYWRRYLARMKFLNLKKARLEEARSKSAIVIQAYWRRYSARKRYLQLRYYTVLVQARIRMIMSVASYKRIVWAAVTIQHHLRATKLMKEDRGRYEILKSSALTIQSAFRRWRTRKMKQKIAATLVLQAYFRKWQASKLAKRRTAALVIQSWYRMHIDLKQYLCIKQSVTKIQAWYRCQLARRTYLEHRARIVTIQQYYRAYRSGRNERENYLQKHKAIIVLQAAFRGMKARMLYRQTRAACVVQSLWRMRQERLRFLRIKQSILTLQSHVRKYQQVKRYKATKNAASVIQARYRAHVATRKAASSFQKMRLAVLVLQSAYRGMQARKEARILRSVVKIQSSYRAYIVRKKFKSLKDATVKIQAFVRMRQAHKRYCTLRKAALYVQQRYRSRRYVLQLKEDYTKLKGACIRIQAAVRGCLVRKQIQRWKKAAIFLQACYRMRRDRQRYLSIYSAAVVVQRRFRASREQRRRRQDFLRVKSAAVCLQAAYRGYKVRKARKLEYSAAVKIQTAFRTHAARMKFWAMIQACIVIQRWYRNCKAGNRQRLSFLTARAAVLSLQAAFRGWKVRKQIQRKHVAATTLQSAFRKFLAQKRFRLTYRAVLTLQQHYRARVTGQKQRQEYVELRNCVIRIQAIWRGKTERRQIQKLHTFATIIQSYYKMHRNQQKYQKLRQATLVIQRYFRSYCRKKTQRTLYLKTKAAVLVLQSAYRGMTVRKQLSKLSKAATVIQAAFRSYLVKKEYVALRSAAVVIQRRYRAVMRAKCLKQKYLSLRKATVRMQAIYRGVRVRRQIHRMHQAAVAIQAMFKMHRINIRYRAMRMAAAVIQRRYRAFCLGRVQRNKYLKLKNSTIILQAACRGLRVRRGLKAMHRSAAIIQSYYRMHRQRRDFRKLLLAARQIQQWFRACRERNAQVHNYMIVKKAVLCIQAAFRGMKTRRLIRTMNASAELIQRRFRTFMKRKYFISLKAAAIAIQRKYRATKLAKTQRQKYLSLLNATVIIQSAYRGFVVRKKIQQMHRAATVIQATLRMHKTYISYQAVRLASVIIQQHYRAYRAGKRARETYLKLHNSVLVIQAAFRGMKTRSLMKKRGEAALTIQKNYRMYKQYHHYRKVQWATQLIQKRYRANKLKKIAVQYFTSLKKAAICIQKAFRERRAKKHREMHYAAVILQKNFKAFRERQRYLSLKAATIVLQRRYRALILSRYHTREYLSLCRATIRIQAAYRGIRARENFKCMCSAARKIQAAYRMHQSRRSYQNMRIAAIVIQNYYRSYIKGKNERKKYLTIKRAALVIQASYRGMKERQKLKIMHVSATVIQSSYRMYVQYQYYKRLQWAVRVAQRRFRAKMAKEAEVKQYVKNQKAFLHIQLASHAKNAWQLDKNTEAAQCARAFSQMSVQRKDFLAMKAAAIIIQSMFRGRRARTRYELIRSSAVTIQRWYRACCTARLQQAEYSLQRQAIISIQSAYRGMKARKMAREIRAARKIQAFLKMVVHRRRFIQLKRAATTLQAYYLMHKTKSEYLRYKKAAVVLQRCYRSYLTAKQQRKTYLQIQKNIIIVQARVRGFIEKKRFQRVKESAIKIQAFFRGSIQRRQFLRCKSSVILIQQHFRAYQMQKVEQRFLQMTMAAIGNQASYRSSEAKKFADKIRAAQVIQAEFLGCKAQKEYASLVKACVTQSHFSSIVQQRIWFLKMKVCTIAIQRRWRATLTAREVRHQFLASKKAAVKIQLAYRQYRARRLIKKISEQKHKKRLLYFTAAAYHHISAIKIQRAYRIHLVLKHAQNKISSVLVIQRWFRAKAQQKRFHRDYQRIIRLQRMVRVWLRRRSDAATVIQRNVRRFLAYRRSRKLAAGIAKVQALWRGYSWRKSNDTAKTKALRLSLVKANEKSREENKLCNRTAIAIEYLLKYKHLSYILAALKHLEVVTLLSPVCCENMAQSRAIFTIFVLIRSCNRSVPCMDVIKYSIQVLLNVSKYEKTTQAVYEVENSVDTLLDLLQMYRGKAGDKISEKGGSIFTKTCCLLAILSKDSKRALEIRSMPRAVACIQSLYKLTARKHRMDAERTLVKQKTSTCITGTPFVPVTPVRTKTVSRIKPAWVLRKDNMQEIVDPLQAILMVMDTLGIACY
ncbi:PREDICTED: abnormal spindle-like microcephaly-associated protein [Tinamus guttatus]|uniref:abnormal spindle-like microcephaly-associated protein n=1 Tax=Tinamus guttatus TaxID=94827 RepID=UPI00052F0259|nr:PREDICTED: abnormal spindle-like microcephaly-associated protein [Tinamus guttatus]